MTVEAQNPDGSPIVASGPYNGNGVTVNFDFDFPITAEGDLKVVRQNADLTETILTLATHYTITGVGADAGGFITLTGGALLPTGAKLLLLLDMEFDQPVDYSNQGRIQLSLLETSLDRLTLVTRQLREELSRAVTVDAFGTTDLATLRTNIAALGLIEDEIAAVAANITNVSTVAGISAAVSTVAGIAAAVSTVAANAAAVSAVAGSIASVNAVNGALAEVNTVAANIAEVILAASFNPPSFVTKTGFFTDVADKVTTASEGVSFATRLDTLLPTNAALYDLAEDGAWADPISFWVEEFFAGTAIAATNMYTSTALASGTLVAQVNPTGSARVFPGIGVTFRSSTSANSGFRVLGPAFDPAAGGNFRFRARLTAESSPGTLYAGVHSSVDHTAPTRGYYFDMNAGSLRANWKGSGAAISGPTVPPAVSTGDTYILQIDRDAEAAETRFRAWKVTRVSSVVTKTLVIDDTIADGISTSTNISPSVVATSPGTTATNLWAVHSIGFGILAK